MQKNISVIVPVYNCVSYIRRCVKSILAQTYSVYEIILVDDGSTDGSGEICDEFSKEIRVKIVHQSNQGVSNARNVGINISSGEYLAFVDADDELPPYAFELLCSSTDAAELYIGSCMVRSKDNGSDLLVGNKTEYSKEEMAYDMMCEPKTKALMSGVWGKLFLSCIVKAHMIMFDENWQNGEDGLFMVEYLKYVMKAVHFRDCQPVYYLYRYCADERISAVSAFYPDFFEFYLIHSERLYAMVSGTDMDQPAFYSKFIDSLIVFLVWAYAYQDFFENNVLKLKLKEIVEKRLVCKAIKYYKREKKSYSVAIPMAIYLKSVNVLTLVLKMRAKKYILNRKKNDLLKSVYREDILK